MRRFNFRDMAAWLIIAILFFPLSAPKAQERLTGIDALAHAVLAFAQEYTGMKANGLPTIKLAAPCDISEMFSPGQDCNTAVIKAVALYDGGVMWLPNDRDWSKPSLKDAAILLHEMVHHVQAENGLTPSTVSCVRSELEAPAYDAMFAFLRATGMPDVYEFMGTNAISVMILTYCDHSNGYGVR